MTSEPPPLYTDRTTLRTAMYADPTKLKTRIAVYDYQEPRHDLRVHVRAFLDGIAGPFLDVGCGAGAYARMLRAEHPDDLVVAADLSAGMAAAGGAPNTVADATALPFPDGTFGAAIALHMLYHVPNPVAAITEIRRVLRPGGTVVISTNSADDKSALRAVHAQAAAEVGATIPGIGPSNAFNLDLAESLVREQFATVQRLDLESVVTVPIPEPVVAFIDSTRSFYNSPESVLPPVRRIVEEVIARDGAFTFRTHSGFLVCR